MAALLVGLVVLVVAPAFNAFPFSGLLRTGGKGETPIVQSGKIQDTVSLSVSGIPYRR